jgi:hypothetical protein
MKSFFCLACSHIPFSLLLSIEGANVNERMLEPYTAYLAGATPLHVAIRTLGLEYEYYEPV